MITVHVVCGTCGLNTVIRAFRIHRKHVGIAINSVCDKVMALEGPLRKLNITKVVKTPFNKNIVYKEAGKHSLHAACSLPCGVVEAAEVEMGMTSVKDASIILRTNEWGLSDALQSTNDSCAG
jgi:hypothetical protein